MNVLKYLSPKTPRMIDDVKVNGQRPDLDLITMRSQQPMRMSDLHLHKDRPLVIIASSIS